MQEKMNWNAVSKVFPFIASFMVKGFSFEGRSKLALTNEQYGNIFSKVLAHHSHEH